MTGSATASGPEDRALRGRTTDPRAGRIAAAGFGLRLAGHVR
jgi:hypothetical protein